MVQPSLADELGEMIDGRESAPESLKFAIGARTRPLLFLKCHSYLRGRFNLHHTLASLNVINVKIYKTFVRTFRKNRIYLENLYVSFIRASEFCLYYIKNYKTMLKQIPVVNCSIFIHQELSTSYIIF